jgi:hypothetical protein
LLSAGRDAYAQGPELVLRAAVALACGVLLVALMQWPGWRALAQAAVAEPRRAGLPQAAALGSRAAK